MNKIKELREQQGITQKELGEILGVDRTTVAKWESGENIPRTRMLKDIANALKCKVEILL